MRYTFDAYLLDTTCYELYRAGTRVPLRPKALEVLAYLVVHHDRVVSKQELLAQLWPDQVIGEDGLKAYIMAVRQALGEQGSAPRPLQTVRGRGYRVVAPVTMADAPPVHLPPSSPLLSPVQEHAEPAAALGGVPALPATAPVVPPAPAPLPLSAERKVVTVLVCALAETTTPATPLEPEALHSLRHAVLAQAVEAVQQYGGTIQRLLDDGCVALFGAPVAHEDHALRAVLAATWLHQQLRTAAAGAEPCHGQGLTVRIGVHTGPVVVGPMHDHQILMVTAVSETLQPLSASESQTVFQAALGTTSLPQALVHAIVQKAEGNPFFLEEFVRVMVEHGGQASALAVPETVQAVLAARIDRLLPEAKRLLQLAAVIGREIALPLLQAAAALPAEALYLHLRQLQAAEALYETQLVPAVAYTFQHALTQEVAYASLVQRTRQQMHGHMARLLEAPFPAVVQAQPELLAHHALRAEMWDKAVTYCRQAGEQALARSAYPEGVPPLSRPWRRCSICPRVVLCVNWQSICDWPWTRHSGVWGTGDGC